MELTADGSDVSAFNKFLIKFKDEASLHRAYRAFKEHKFNLKIDPKALLLQVEVKWTKEELEKLLKMGMDLKGFVVRGPIAG